MGNNISLENSYSIDTTILSFHFDINNNCFMVECNPSYGIMTLKKTHPNFIGLYNKLKIGATYNFKCSNWVFNLDEIIDITDCKVFTIWGKIVGFVNIKNEIQTLKHYDEIIFENDMKKRFLINENIKGNFIIGKKYKINSIKKFGDNFYNVVDYELIK
jgi:hypothetical protein